MTSIALRQIRPALFCGLLLGAGANGAAAEELRIGFLAPTTGIFAQAGKDMVDGFRMYLDENKSNFGGAEVKFIAEDTVAKPDTAVTKARKLILQDKVHLIIGGLLASTGYALAPVSTEPRTNKAIITSTRRNKPSMRCSLVAVRGSAISNPPRL